jgi:hypothetical protein
MKGARAAAADCCDAHNAIMAITTQKTTLRLSRYSSTALQLLYCICRLSPDVLGTIRISRGTPL